MSAGQIPTCHVLTEKDIIVGTPPVWPAFQIMESALQRIADLPATTPLELRRRRIAISALKRARAVKP